MLLGYAIYKEKKAETIQIICKNLHEFYFLLPIP